MTEQGGGEGLATERSLDRAWIATHRRAGKHEREAEQLQRVELAAVEAEVEEPHGHGAQRVQDLRSESERGWGVEGRGSALLHVTRRVIRTTR